MDAVRAMTWNTWWRFGGNWREREPGLVEVLLAERPDLLGIQECWGTTEQTQADRFAQVLGAEAAFVGVSLPPAPIPVEEPDQAEVRMGLGLVSRWPIEAVEECPMPSADRHLVALRARIAHPRGPLHVVVGATSWEQDRVAETSAQVAELGRLVEQVRGELPVILLADLNYDFELPALAALELADGWDAAEPDADPRTLSSTNRFAPPEAANQYDRRIDHVLFDPGSVGATAKAARIIRDEPNGFPPSDHYPVVVDLAF
jgi:endonuclease/exonuclease/phosphatase family metal-dependent hydrolase